MRVTVMCLVFLVSLLVSFGATLYWNQNIEGDLAGYVIYYGEDSYKFRIDVENVTRYPLSECLRAGDYLIHITAYDTSDNESRPSEELGFVTDGAERLSCSGDFNGDGGVDLDDLIIFIMNMDGYTFTDFNCDGNVDILDILILIEDYSRRDCLDCGLQTCM